LDGIERSANTPKTFSLAYCFFVVMGGFVIATQDIDPAQSRSTITAEGILSLAREGQFISIDESHISDRSKADIFAKGLVCFQVLWMLVQCIARKSAGYPLTLLELHTFVHVCCALGMYVLWFKVSSHAHTCYIDPVFFAEQCFRNRRTLQSQLS
jgi:hypothetical protein